MALPTSTALFPDKDAALASLRADMALGAANYLPYTLLTPSPEGDALLWGKLVAAEAEAEKQLRTFFGPVEVLPDDAPQDEIDALESAQTRYVQEAAYDYESGMFLPDEYGMLPLGYRPVQKVHSVVIRTPSPFLQSFTVPDNWLRLDRKYGHLRFFPTSTPIGIPAGTLGIGFLSTGSYPNAIGVRYTAGMANSGAYAVIWNDLIEVVKKMAILNMLKTSMRPASESISGDGLSQSKSYDIEKWQGVVDTALFGPKGANGGLFAYIHGVIAGTLG